MSITKLFTVLFTNSEEPSPWKTDTCYAGQEIPCLVWNPEVGYHVQNSQHWAVN